MYIFRHVYGRSPESALMKLRPSCILTAAVIAAIAIATVTGCSPPTNVSATNFEKSYPRTVPDLVVITTERLLKPPYLEVGYLYVEEPTLEHARKIAQLRASEMGGHLIVDARAGINITQVGSFIVPLYDRSFFIKGIVVRRTAR